MNGKKYDLSSLHSYGKGVYISPNVEIKRPYLVEVGNHVAIDSYFYCTTALYLGDYIHIGPSVTVIGGEDGVFLLGNFCTIAAGCRIVCRGDAHNGAGLVSPVIPPAYRDDVEGHNIVMNKFSALGTNVVMLPNTWLAEGVVVGANSLVTKPIKDPWTIWAGSPAKKLKDRPKGTMIRMAQELGYE